ncbi:aromatic ring-hydroxylating dioxygenase subunit alpha [Nocardia sp. NPDC127579]|uniref:aromatic ring-hydroxylating oxygenase subunit alpha n=1 Tax=Nocardia sp. NPDC127579 TaxID=3345402 RepID=UPI00363D329C
MSVLNSGPVASGPLADRGIQDGPHPFPTGWFTVAFADEIAPGAVLARTFMGREIVLFRTVSGKLHATEAYCPHLGAHLGRGGRVYGETIECPFHTFRFDGQGTCVFTPYKAASPPPAARLGILPVCEVFGIALVYNGAPGKPPWEIDVPSDDGCWRPLHKRKLELSHSHPQEIAENGVDYGHFTELHGFSTFEVVSPLRFDGPRLRSVCRTTRPTPVVGPIGVEIDIRVDGLGFSVVESTLDIGWKFRQLVLVTPTVGRHQAVHIATSVHRRSTSRIVSRFLSPFEWILGRFILELVTIEFHRDRVVWENKKYMAKPALAQGDGPIHKFRRWANQFYPELEDVNAGK